MKLQDKFTAKRPPKTSKFPFFFSLLFHTTILVLVGGIVLIPAAVKKAAFTSDASMVSTQESTPDTPPDASQVNNELPNSQAPQENLQLPDKTDPIAPTDIVIARPDSSMASSSWASSVSSSTPINTSATFSNLSESHSPSPADPQSEKSKAVMGSKMTLFGSTDSEDTNGIQGTFYDLKRIRSGSDNPVDVRFPDAYRDVIRKFTDSNWDIGVLEKYWRAPNTLFAHQIYIPGMPADEGPKCFGVKAQASGWVVHYKGYITPAKSGTYRFCGKGDDLLIVRLNNQVVLDGSLGVGQPPADFEKRGKLINYSRYYVNWPANPEQKIDRDDSFVFGDWVTLERDVPYPFEAIIGERPGGGFSAYLVAEKKGVQKDPTTVDVFSTDSDLPSSLVETMKKRSNKLVLRPVQFKVVPAPSTRPNS